MEYIIDHINKFIEWAQNFNFTADIMFLIIISVFLFIGFIRGWKKGLYKSFYYTLTSAILIVVAVFMLPMIMDFVKSYDISFLKITLEGYPLNTINDLPNIVTNAYPQIGQYLIASGLTITLNELVMAFMTLYIFMFTILILWMFGWLIQGLLYHILFKHFVSKKARERKIGFIGGIFGALRTFIFLCAVLVPVAAFNVYFDVASITPDNQVEELLVKASEAYDSSFVGQVMNYKLGSESLNEMLLKNITKIEK